MSCLQQRLPSIICKKCLPTHSLQCFKVGSESAESGEGIEGDCPMDEEIDLDSLKSYSSPDVLICGNCRFVKIFFSHIHTGDNDDHVMVHDDNDDNDDRDNNADNDDNVPGWCSPRSTQWSPTRGTTAS